MNNTYRVPHYYCSAALMSIFLLKPLLLHSILTLIGWLFFAKSQMGGKTIDE